LQGAQNLEYELRLIERVVDFYGGWPVLGLIGDEAANLLVVLNDVGADALDDLDGNSRFAVEAAVGTCVLEGTANGGDVTQGDNTQVGDFYR